MSNVLSRSPKATAFQAALVVVYAADFVTKRMATAYLVPAHTPHQVVDDFIRLTLVYNKDAAMGLSLGEYSRVGFTLTAAVILVVLAALYRRTPGSSKGYGVALGMITAGALGNLTDRILSPVGVIDFIDIGIGAARFWTFNVADAGVSCGAVLLAAISMKEDREKKRGGLKPSGPAGPGKISI